ncbi:putative DNAJ domain protein [Leptomonas pyrrhocoris]|uniref:Putative DNAJ domain protein n=1 Tax=Leptomonas pyrrhocoris TaxID=157538 RepID=A0A0N0DXQ1_LEPPY|nr:putative DNAJ domain protein [Leptomonas pyrrhocoris]KPA83211.1 putative DNAJ domain protein [Leptomonas pyrrhocoris]|eukprot:XP_015661650.1 putative DNAJ domain protein [Leptomonas pyrrhocoris]
MPSIPKPSDGAAAGGSSMPSSARAKTLYETLGVAPTATTAEITTAYRKLALAYHPDRPEGSKEKFQELSSAYEMLNNPTNRSRYDTLMKSKPVLKNFKRPPPMENVDKPVYTLLADLAFYEFEAAPNKLRCSFHYGDGIEFNGERGSFIGLAGDGYVYWSVNGRGYATQLFKADSDMALSNVRVVYRSNMGLLRKPLARSWAGSNASPPQQPLRSSTRPSASSVQSGGSAHGSKTAGRGGPRPSEAERIREQLRRKERHRSIAKRLETIEKDEAEERNYLERRLWDRFCTLQTNLEAGMRCVTLGMPVTAELALFMGYTSSEAVPLMSPVPGNLPGAAEIVSPQAAALWVDPLEGSTATGDDTAHPANDEFDQQQQPSPSPPSPSSPSSASSRSDGDSDTASDSDSCRARPTTTGPGLPNRTGYSAAYVSPQQSGSSPLLRRTLRPTVSASSSLGNNMQQPSPAPAAQPRSVSLASSPGPYGLPAATMASHGLAADAHPVRAPHAIHNVLPGGSSTTVQYAFGSPRPRTAIPAAAIASVDRENEGLVKALGIQQASRASRASLQDADQPSSLPTSLPSPLGYGISRNHGEATLANPKEATAQHLASVPLAANEGAGVDTDQAGALRNSASGGVVTSPRPLYPWSIEHDPQRDSQSRATVREAIPAPPARRSAEAEHNRTASLPTAAAFAATSLPSSCPRVTASTAKGSPCGVGDGGDGDRSSWPSPHVTHARTSALSSPLHTAAVATELQDRLPKPSPRQDDAHRAVPHGHTASGEGPRIMKLRPLPGQPGSPTAAAGYAPEIDAAGSPQLMAPSGSHEAHTVTGPATASGHSGTVQSFARGESDCVCTSYGVLFGGAIDHSFEEVPHMGTQSTSHTSGSAAAAAAAAARGQYNTPSHQHHEDVVQGSFLSPPSGRATYSATTGSANYLTPVDASATPDSSDAGAAAPPSGAPLPSSSPLTGKMNGPRVTMAPLRLSASQDDGLRRSVAEELDPPPQSPNAAMALEVKKRLKGRVTPRYMLATEAHSRRTSGLPPEVTGAGGQTQSPQFETLRGHNSRTAEEMLAEEEDFMSAFAKTKRAI